MEEILVSHASGDRFVMNIRGHEVVVDQPIEDGGTDMGPTPTELFVAGLVSCVGHYARRYLARHDLEHEGLRVRASWTMADDRPARVGSVSISIETPGFLPVERKAALLAVAGHCTVHNSLHQPPHVEITLAGSSYAAAG